MEWPSNGEIDIMEWYQIKGVPHILANAAWGTERRYNAKWNSKAIPFSYFTGKDPDWASQFHIWRMDWDEQFIRLYLDDELLNEISLAETINGSLGDFKNPFHQPHYLLLNYAIGGDNGGTPDPKMYPARYEIDYVKVYQKDNFPKKVSQNLIPVAKGWANNSINTAVFRKNSLVTIGDTQFIAFYDSDGYVVLGKRNLRETHWDLKRSRYTGNVKDAHNIISIMVDGEGYLHVAWDHHGHPLRYAKGIAPYSTELGEKEIMIGDTEGNVTYPEFFRMPNGDLLFMYRDGSSGSGNLVINCYDLTEKKWIRLQNNLIDGEKKRNAYWQACVDNQGVIHISWVWRESWLVETNHDLCYAKSLDGGKTWHNSQGKSYSLPIRKANAEIVSHIPQGSELINQTSMTTDSEGYPYIAAYWREANDSVPQYHVVYQDRKKWETINLNFRKTPFSLKGGGTKKIPVSRPQILVGKSKEKLVHLIFRDEERGSKVSVATCGNLKKRTWTIRDLTDFSVDSWEPTFDTELWRNMEEVHIFVQNTSQIDGEGLAEIPPQMIYVLELGD